MAKSREVHFEDEVVAALTEPGGSGWALGDNQGIDLQTGIASDELMAFVGATQPEEWDRLVTTLGGDVERAQVEFRKRVAGELDARGTVDVLRNGVRGWGCWFRLCFFRPSSRKNPALWGQYEANRLTVTRQQRYSAAHGNTLDVVLWVNGLAVATVELKNPLSGQTVEHAKVQYKRDRDPRDPFLWKRAVVHFAVDPHLVFMTTRLAGDRTWFLPFNRGDGGRKGNPPAPPGKHRTAYLWEQVWEREAFLDLVGRFIDTDWDKDTGGTTIFPRYHQWDAVRRAEAHARAHGVGHKYLFQHSAGSGKSNSIAWLSHRLSVLHDDADRPVFDKVIVITDRRVLDDQLSKTVGQFEQTAGVVRRIEDKDASKSKNLAEALHTETARIVLCTLQTFSFVDKALAVGQRNYAVVIDEAHSSQTGAAASDLKGVLGARSEEERLRLAEKAEAGEEVTAEDKIVETVAARGRQANLSFFAFTATPKARTVTLFGTPGPEGTPRPFHVYSMRQAVEEGFILDVLTQYTTFDVYWRVRQTSGHDPEVARAKASSEIGRTISLHAHNLAQRAKIIIDHYRRHVRSEIGGQAKAMVVTASRLHAVRYKQAIDRYLADEHITDTRALVAFSGTVTDPDEPGDGFTEAGMNKIPEAETANRFKGEDGFDPDSYQVMIVAEKYQTGFDAPQLLAMYVDKKLEGVNAVQTLARLNRTHPGKPAPFVLDFRNDAEAIAEAFRPWYDTTISEPVDANTLYTFQGNLASAGVFTTAEVDHYWTVFADLAPNERRGNGALYSALEAPLARFTDDLDDDTREQFRTDLDTYLRGYSFLSQIATWTDPELEKLYVFAKSLKALLPRRDNDGAMDLGTEVELTHLRIEKQGELNASLADETSNDDPLTVYTGGGSTGSGDPQTERLSAIVNRLNEKHGLNLSLTDALLFEQFKDDWTADPDIQAAASANDIDNFMIIFAKKFMTVVLARMDTNADIFKAILDDDTFAKDLQTSYGQDVYHLLRDDQ